MSEKLFEIGDDVMPRGGARGSVIEYRESPAGGWIVGVVTTNGRIDYYVETALKSADGMIG